MSRAGPSRQLPPAPALKPTPGPGVCPRSPPPWPFGSAPSKQTRRPAAARGAAPARLGETPPPSGKRVWVHFPPSLAGKRDGSRHTPGGSGTCALGEDPTARRLGAAGPRGRPAVGEQRRAPGSLRRRPREHRGGRSRQKGLISGEPRWIPCPAAGSLAPPLSLPRVCSLVAEELQETPKVATFGSGGGGGGQGSGPFAAGNAAWSLGPSRQAGKKLRCDQAGGADRRGRSGDAGSGQGDAAGSGDAVGKDGLFAIAGEGGNAREAARRGQPRGQPRAGRRDKAVPGGCSAARGTCLLPGRRNEGAAAWQPVRGDPNTEGNKDQVQRVTLTLPLAKARSLHGAAGSPSPAGAGEQRKRPPDQMQPPALQGPAPSIHAGLGRFHPPAAAGPLARQG